MQTFEITPANFGILIHAVRKIAEQLVYGQIDPDDITQDVMVNLLTRKGVPKIVGSSYLYTVVKNATRDEYRFLIREGKHVDRSKPLDISGSMYESAFDDHLHPLPSHAHQEESVDHEVLSLLKQFIDELPSSQHQAVSLYMQGYTYKEMAERLNLSIGTIRSRIHYAKKKIQQQVENRR